jgi:hypothetical protein
MVAVVNGNETITNPMSPRLLGELISMRRKIDEAAPVPLSAFYPFRIGTLIIPTKTFQEQAVRAPDRC